jgi:putative transposase
VHAVRTDVLAAAYTRNPERFVRKHPEPAELPAAAWINKPTEPDPDDDEPAHSKKP